MNLKLIKYKVKQKFWATLIKITETSKIQPYFYSSFWHYLFHKKDEYIVTENMYFTCMPHPFAGIGHQMANWISGYWWAKQLGVKFAHLPFSTKKWEEFLGFGFGEPQVEELRKQGYKLKRIPSFFETNLNSIELVKKIITSYRGKKVVFIPPQDHGYKNQFGIRVDLKRKFNLSPARLSDKLVYKDSNFNIAIHVRRTVVIEGRIVNESEQVRALRWLSNDYYEKILKKVLVTIHPSKPIVIHVFSTARLEEFEEFNKYGDIYWGNTLDEYQTFLHLIRADLLITSKSSFSYKPALMSEGIKICPKTFWHGYPDSADFILADNTGNFNINKLKDFIL